MGGGCDCARRRGSAKRASLAFLRTCARLETPRRANLARHGPVTRCQLEILASLARYPLTGCASEPTYVHAILVLASRTRLAGHGCDRCNRIRECAHGARDALAYIWHYLFVEIGVSTRVTASDLAARLRCLVLVLATRARCALYQSRPRRFPVFSCFARSTLALRLHQLVLVLACNAFHALCLRCLVLVLTLLAGFACQ